MAMVAAAFGSGAPPAVRELGGAAPTGLAAVAPRGARAEAGKLGPAFGGTATNLGMMARAAAAKWVVPLSPAAMK